MLTAIPKRNLCWRTHAYILQYFKMLIYHLIKHCEDKRHFILLSRVFLILRISCALTLKLKYKLKTLRQTFKLFGKDLVAVSSTQKFICYVELRESLFKCKN